jgi:hypothetical protein
VPLAARIPGENESIGVVFENAKHRAPIIKPQFK